MAEIKKCIPDDKKTGDDGGVTMAETMAEMKMMPEMMAE